MASPHCKIRRVRLKAGGEVHILHRDECDLTKEARHYCKTVIEAHTANGDNIVGMALVVWSSKHTSTCTARTNGAIPAIFVPEFVKSRLLADKIEQWTLESLEEPSDGAS